MPGLSAALAIRRLQSLLEVFRDYDSCLHEFTFCGDAETETPALRRGRVLVDTRVRRVAVLVGDEWRVLPQRVNVTESLHWKMIRQPPRQPVGGIRSEAFRGDPSRAQISSSSMRYYEEWMDSEKEVAASGEKPNHISMEMRERIHSRAHALLESVTLPMRVRSVVINSFGSIPTNWSTYHSEKYIWPIGFK